MKLLKLSSGTRRHLRIKIKFKNFTQKTKGRPALLSSGRQACSAMRDFILNREATYCINKLLYQINRGGKSLDTWRVRCP